MRKQDRVAAEQQNRSPQQPHTKEQGQMKEREQIKGSASQNPPTRPPRQPGKLPLPD